MPRASTIFPKVIPELVVIQNSVEVPEYTDEQLEYEKEMELRRWKISNALLALYNPNFPGADRFLGMELSVIAGVRRAVEKATA